ncbi:MAG: hypothetical protein ABI461_12340 [Polyangiaceae bacterium]
MQTAAFGVHSGIRCRNVSVTLRRLVLPLLTLVLFFSSTSAFARHSHGKQVTLSLEHAAPGSIDLSNSIGPLDVSHMSFSASGFDGRGRDRDATLSGTQLGVDRLIFDQIGLALRIGVIDHFSIGIPLSFGVASAPEAIYPSSSQSASAIRANGDAAFLLEIGVSPGYEINFGDSAIRFDTTLLARGIFIPTNLTNIGKKGQRVAAPGSAGEIAFEPRITVLPWARGDLGIGFFAEMNATHPEDWSCGGVIQLRWGKKS